MAGPWPGAGAGPISFGRPERGRSRADWRPPGPGRIRGGGPGRGRVDGGRSGAVGMRSDHLPGQPPIIGGQADAGLAGLADMQPGLDLDLEGDRGDLVRSRSLSDGSPPDWTIPSSESHQDGTGVWDRPLRFAFPSPFRVPGAVGARPRRSVRRRSTGPPPRGPAGASSDPDPDRDEWGIDRPTRLLIR